MRDTRAQYPAEWRGPKEGPGRDQSINTLALWEAALALLSVTAGVKV